ncbi:MAG: histidine triad nucleotide-binding protein [Alphaproteobacteria bacterium]|nr:histidine triad nucleotide-binding protein [Alphaproteobacteria bacterium]
MSYDPDNVFARILRGELPCKKVYEDEFALAFHDIRPARPVHVLVIPKGAYVTLDEFTSRAPAAAVAGLFAAVGKVAHALGLSEPGYRIIINNGRDGHQEVPHLHVHVLGGASVGPMVKRLDP